MCPINRAANRSPWFEKFRHRCSLQEVWCLATLLIFGGASVNVYAEEPSANSSLFASPAELVAASQPILLEGKKDDSFILRDIWVLPPRPQQLPPTRIRTLALDVSLPATTRNLTVGPTWTAYSASFDWNPQARFVSLIHLGSDSATTALVNGLMLDDLHGMRLVAINRYGILAVPRREQGESRWFKPSAAVGVQMEGLLETHNLLQYLRTMSAMEFYAGFEAGAFVSLAFANLTVTLLAHPLTIARHWSGSESVSHQFSYDGPGVDLEVSLPLALLRLRR